MIELIMMMRPDRLIYLCASRDSRTGGQIRRYTLSNLIVVSVNTSNSIPLLMSYVEPPQTRTMLLTLGCSIPSDCIESSARP